jgi:hypothetical protein
MRISTAASLSFWLTVSLVHEVARAQEPRELLRTEFGSEFSDGSSTIAGDSASFELENGAVLLKIDSGRPVAGAVHTLQVRYGYIITYEDPRYTNEDDLQDVSASVVRNYSQYAPGMAPKVVVPKGGKLTLNLPASSNVSSDDLAAILQQLIRAQTISPRGGHFRVEQAADAFHVVPIEVRDRKGNWSRYSSLLDTPISLPEEDRSEEELYRAITAAVSAAKRVRLEVMVNGGIVIGLDVPSLLTTVGATQESARSVLTRALQLHRNRRTWALLHGPEDGNDVFMLNIWDFPTKTQAANPAPTR